MYILMAVLRGLKLILWIFTRLRVCRTYKSARDLDPLTLLASWWVSVQNIKIRCHFARQLHVLFVHLRVHVLVQFFGVCQQFKQRYKLVGWLQHVQYFKIQVDRGTKSVKIDFYFDYSWQWKFPCLEMSSSNIWKATLKKKIYSMVCLLPTQYVLHLTE